MVQIAIKYKLDYLFVGLLSLVVFAFIIKNVDTDIQTHMEMVKQLNNGGDTHAVHGLYFFLINLFSFFSSDTYLLAIASLMVLTIFSLLKYQVTTYVIRDYCKQNHIVIANKVLVLSTLGLFLCFSIPDVYQWFVLNRMYLGKIPPHVWHNSTTIILIPLALLLFYEQYKALFVYKSITTKGIIILTLLVVANALAKPSFLFVFIPITSIYVLLDLKKKYMFLIPLSIGVLIIGLQTLALQKLGYSSGSVVSFSTPFEVYLSRTPIWYFPMGLVFTYLFPLILVFSVKGLAKERIWLYTAWMTALGIFISKTVVENGIQKFDGNFSWQNVVCCYIMFVVSVVLGFKVYSRGSLTKNRMRIIVFTFCLHVIAGGIYLLKIFLTKSYA